MVVLVVVVVDVGFDVNLNLNFVATIDDSMYLSRPAPQSSPRCSTVNGGDQVQVQVHVKGAVHVHVYAQVNVNARGDACEFALLASCGRSAVKGEFPDTQ